MIRGTTKTSKTSKFVKLAVKTKSVLLQLKKQLAERAMVKQLAQLISLTSLSQAPLLLNQLKVNSPILRVGILAFVLIGIPGILAMPEECHAQTPTTISLEKVAQNAFDTFYKTWRWPICGLLMLGAVGVYLFAGDRGKGAAVGICVGILMWALVPYFINTFKGWTGDTTVATPPPAT